jgi:hypothetical protein
MKELVFLLEENSAKVMIEGILPKILKSDYSKIHLILYYDNGEE